MTTKLEPLPPTKYALALHTTTPELGLVISNFAEDTRTHVWNLGRDLSSHIHQYLIDLIQPQTWTDLAFIAVAKGPGGFTGTRIGVVTARTLGQQLEIPVFAISTLAAVAWQIPPTPLEKGGYISTDKGVDVPIYEGVDVPPLLRGVRGDQIIAVEMQAQRGQVFGAIYQIAADNSGIIALLPDTVFTPEKWQETLANWHTEYQLIKATSGLAATVSSILELAYLEWQQNKRPHWSEALPYYGQHPVDL
ncbi:tRNA (adenosine(37)-N6)-threonylcarbamoyltransferase complex dimerization subunit type 1 TsaB [Anabaena sphaerica FACHB-251]|uniref:tRNA (Adenosine(37)-N6)-threonylcarbamoyltransferase complex dimerization subunit type 1 TsaB n=1 Tax=Anabaena sphaerica FACHB-251 TaxID=2692883 RepID=A0A926WJY9_9NOST|nr:tRNA (adenosine(37)-N6)-threonylcarbamoyltransferase complex dimerization subunit type 1 TsaB [Anabaena sphaerica]MBD2295555.1 tRNA (adenosine(37)-N6)-threonylcarbamoyltransferase complex dimerization subunit type 1 TsaB [Anabaena sphaerica FACHB-251]